VRRDVRLERDVALKVLAPSLTDSPAARERFQREARAVAALIKRHKASVVVATFVAVIAVGSAAWFRFHTSPRTETALKNVPFASLGGEESGPAFSPDGNRMGSRRVAWIAGNSPNTIDATRLSAVARRDAMRAKADLSAEERALTSGILASP